MAQEPGSVLERGHNPEVTHLELLVPRGLGVSLPPSSLDLGAALGRPFTYPRSPSAGCLPHTLWSFLDQSVQIPGKTRNEFFQVCTHLSPLALPKIGPSLLPSHSLL